MKQQFACKEKYPSLHLKPIAFIFSSEPIRARSYPIRNEAAQESTQIPLDRILTLLFSSQ